MAPKANAKPKEKLLWNTRCVSWIHFASRIRSWSSRIFFSLPKIGKTPQPSRSGDRIFGPCPEYWRFLDWTKALLFGTSLSNDVVIWHCYLALPLSGNIPRVPQKEKLTDSEKKKIKQDNKAKADPKKAEAKKEKNDACREKRKESGSQKVINR